MAANFHVYMSSAGSGKTYTLVKEYLKIVLLDPGAVRHILAITFTNAAAAEMKGRIIEALGNISDLKINNGNRKGIALLNDIVSDLKNKGNSIPSEDTVIENSRLVLKRILHDYSDFAVSTIDSFVHRVIRTFAFDLRLPVNFEVELDADNLLGQAVDLIIDKAGKDREITRLLVSYILNQADDEQDIRIGEKIAKMAHRLTDEDSIMYIERLKDTSIEDFYDIAGKLTASVRSFEGEIKKEAVAALDLINREGIPGSAFYGGNRGSIYSYFKNLADGKIREKLTPGKFAGETIWGNKWFSGKCDPHHKSAITEISGKIREHFMRIQEIAGSGFKKYLCELAFRKTIFPLALLNEVKKVSEEIKKENSILHISDFNREIARTISREAVPFIYERLGERYRHYMIDEFQDTSMLQWQNLLPLVENSLSEGYMNLVVGDGKQAIYRFRNGDVRQFAMLPKLTEEIKLIGKPEWEVSLENNFSKRRLETNWRSERAIVDFNNRYFSFAGKFLNDSLRDIYGDITQKIRSDKNGGYVRICFLDAEGRQDLEQAYTAEIEKIINECLDAGHRCEEIAVLCKANREISTVAGVLLKAGIPVISPDSLLLNQSDEVNFIIAMLKLLSNPYDSVAAVEVMVFLNKNEIPGIKKTLNETLSMMSEPYTNRIEKLLEDEGKSFSFRDFDHLNIYDSCETIIRRFFTQQQPPNPYIAFFMDAVYDFSQKHMLSRWDFLKWWEENGHKYSIQVPEGVNAVRLMTIHKAKGLQFPVVIHPFAAQKAEKPTKPGLWTDGSESGIPRPPAQWLEMSKSSLSGTLFESYLEDELQMTFLDMLNVHYVALTRPSEKLFILTEKEDKGYSTKKVNGLLQGFLKMEGLWKDDTGVYTFGDLLPASSQKQVPEESLSPLRRLISSPWSRALRMRSHQRERSLLLDQDDPLERGTLLHRAMERISRYDDLVPVLEEMKHSGEIDNSTRDEWEEKISKMLSNPEISPYYSGKFKVKTEAGLFDSDGGFYRPDRVVLADDHCALIDYKTGREYGKHSKQMDTYACILLKMGYSNIKKILLYLDEGIVKTL